MRVTGMLSQLSWLLDTGLLDIGLSIPTLDERTRAEL